MKFKNLFQKSTLTLAATSTAAALLVSCAEFNKPLGGSDAYNPLDPPGTGQTETDTDPYGPTFTAGTFLQTVSPQTPFFAKYPKSTDQPDKTLSDYTDVKVVSTKGSYVKVEVVDTGEVGFVPSIMLGEKRSPNEVPVTPGAGEIPVIPGEAPVPDPTDVPSIAPEPEVPSIDTPQVVDPSQPAE